MKIAIPTKENVVDNHFGHCDRFTIFSIDEEMHITASETLPSLQGCGCKSNIAATLKNKGVTIMLAGNMGNGAVQVLQNQGIQVYRGCSGTVQQVAEDFARGNIADSGVNCESHHRHGAGHVCSH